MPSTPKGIVYPDQTGHTRIWEHLATLALGTDGIIVGDVDVQSFTSSGTWTKPAGAILCFAQVVAGGGSGGGAAATAAGEWSFGDGGGAGEYRAGWYDASDLGATEVVTVGTGGVAASGAVGTDGGTSSLGVLISCTGGGAGATRPATSSAQFSTASGSRSGGTGGSGGTVAVPGGAGGSGLGIGSTIGVGQRGGDGGKGHLSGAPTGGSNTAGIVGAQYGGGGSGASRGASQTALAGGSGAAGFVIVVSFTPGP